MENEVKFITSEKGKPLVLFNFHKYWLIRTRKDGLKKWLCIQKLCYARHCDKWKFNSSNIK
jgi:hypothetical protein